MTSTQSNDTPDDTGTGTQTTALTSMVCCAGCLSLPAVSMGLCATGVAIGYGARSTLPTHGRAAKLARGTTYMICSALLLVSLTLAVLDNHAGNAIDKEPAILADAHTRVAATDHLAGLRNVAFAKMCTAMTRKSDLDETRCVTLGLRSIVGDVIEFGPGPGTNFRCWNGSSGVHRWVGVEPNAAFEAAQEEEATARHVNFPRQTVWLRGEDVDVEPASFDAAVLTHVLCSVDDPAAVLAQAARALRPGGRAYVMEHVAAPEGSWMRVFQKLLAPVFAIVANGCQFRAMADILRNTAVRAVALEPCCHKHMALARMSADRACGTIPATPHTGLPSGNITLHNITAKCGLPSGGARGDRRPTANPSDCAAHSRKVCQDRQDVTRPPPLNEIAAVSSEASSPRKKDARRASAPLVTASRCLWCRCAPAFSRRKWSRIKAETSDSLFIPHKIVNTVFLKLRDTICVRGGGEERQPA